MVIYLSAKLERATEMMDVICDLEKLGHFVASTWIYREKLSFSTEDIKQNVLEDLRDIEICDMIIIFSNNGKPSRGGRHVELGYSLALKKRIVLIGERENGFHYINEKIEHYNKYNDFLAMFSKTPNVRWNHL
jgi:nucleoside 2-deoxyribosyltransferase